MFSKFLTAVVHNAGMSCRPEFYSGRGAISSDVNDKILEKIYGEIARYRGAEAGEGFVSMVEGMEVLSATDFLLSLYRLESNAFTWDKGQLPTEKGVYATDHMTGMATILSALGNAGRDETESIRYAFLARHGRKPKQRFYSAYGYDR